jgi:hypothetical protein
MNIQSRSAEGAGFTAAAAAPPGWIVVAIGVGAF